jgi:quercetin dioxygenase-like cupin family protein
MDKISCSKENDGFVVKKMIKNIEHAKVLLLSDEVAYHDGQVVSKTLAQNSRHSLTLFAFEKGEEISSHASDGDAFVLVLDGVGKITINGKDHLLRKGEAIVMPAKLPHAVYAVERFKMLLTVSFP